MEVWPPPPPTSMAWTQPLQLFSSFWTSLSPRNGVLESSTYPALTANELRVFFIGDGNATVRPGHLYHRNAENIFGLLHVLATVCPSGL